MRRHAALYERIAKYYALVVNETWCLPQDRSGKVSMSMTNRDYSACCKFIREGRYTEQQLMEQYPLH